MAPGRRAALAALLALVSGGLHGCGSSSGKDATTTTTPAPAPAPGPDATTTTEPAGPTETTTTSSTVEPTNTSHCRTYGTGHLCTECDDGFDVVDGECMYRCSTDMAPLQMTHSENKGLCLDDTTFQFCTDEIPHMWPNVNERVKSIRLFSSWQGFWPDEGREKAWKALVNVVKKNDMKVLVGTQITCNETDDDRDWKQVLALAEMLGPEHIMGLAVGNELELLYTKSYASPECIKDMWQGGYFWRKTAHRIQSFDALGDAYAKIPVTSVFGAAVLGGPIFFETPNAMCLSYLRNATKEYGHRWVFSLNVYPYLDPNNHMDPGANTCDKAIAQGTCLDEATCMSISILEAMRRKMQACTGRKDDLLWVGETGWSTPQASTLNTPVVHCKDFSSEATFLRNYKNFLSWDMNLTKPDLQGPDHVFYFTMRDSVNFGHGEHFGLVGQCGDVKCKLQPKATESVVVV